VLSALGRQLVLFCNRISLDPRDGCVRGASRRRRQQRTTQPRLEARSATPPVRPSRPHRDRLPLPNRCLEVEPIEHRLFSEISKNWAGRPLDSYETILNYARTTRTSKGLEVNAYLVNTHYPKGMKINDQAMDQLQQASQNSAHPQLHTPPQVNRAPENWEVVFEPPLRRINTPLTAAMSPSRRAAVHGTAPNHLNRQAPAPRIPRTSSRSSRCPRVRRCPGGTTHHRRRSPAHHR